MDPETVGIQNHDGPRTDVEVGWLRKRMRIAYDHQIFGWQRYGGVSRYFFELANNIAISGIDDAAIISPLHVTSYLSAASPKLKVVGRAVPAIRRTGRIYRAVNQLLAPSMMKRFAPDIVHETYFAHRRIAPASSKVVLTVHDMIHELFPNSFSRWDPLREEKAAAVQRADHVICVSEHTRQDLIQLLGVDEAKTSVVHHGFSLTGTGAEPSVPDCRPYLLYVGARGGYKNFDGLLRAYASASILSKNFELVAFGGGDLTDRERALILELGIESNNVRQMGGSDSVLANLYRGAALFVYPSLYEGFGIPPLEAMSFNCPVACSKTSSIPEVVGDAACFFDPESLDSMVDAMESVLRDEALRRDLVARGQKRISRFSWEECASQTQAVYRKVLS